MKNMIRSLILISFLLSAISVYGGAKNNLLFRQLTVKDGLSDNRVRNISMTPDGILIIRTNTMINFYNGATFSYHRFDPQHIIYNEYTGYYDVQFDGQDCMWIKNSEKLWYMDMSTNKYHYNTNDFFAAIGITTPVDNIFVDKHKNYWIVTQDKTFFLYENKRNKLTNVSSYHPEVSTGYPLKMVQDGNLCWIIYDDKSLRCWDINSGKFIFTKKNFLNGNGIDIERIDMCATTNGNLWVMYNQGLIYYDTLHGECKNISNIALKKNDQFTCMDIDKDGRIWLGSSKSGMRIIDGSTFETYNLPNLQLFNGSHISHNTDISDIFVDENNIVWVATGNEGILYYHHSMGRFPLINKSTNENQITDENVKCMVEDSDGTLLFGTINGLFRYFPDTKEIKPTYKELEDELCIGLYRDSENKIWVGTFQNGIFCIDKNKVRHYTQNEPYPVYISYHNLKPYYNSVRTFFEDSDKNLWVSVYGGIGKFDKNTGNIELLSKRFPQIGHLMLIRNIISLNDSTMLITADNGLYCYYPKTDSVAYNPDNQQFIKRITKHNCTIKDSRSMLWFGTHDGLGVWNPKYGKLDNFGLEQGMPENILGIAEDDNGNVWVASPSNISKFEVNESSNGYEFLITHYDVYNGVQDGTFYEHSVLKSQDGTIYFGGNHGVNIINSSDMANNNRKIKPYFTDFRIFNSSIQPGEKYNGRGILNNIIGKTDYIDLKYNESFVTFEFTGLNYINPKQTYYRYKLENFDKDWTEIHPSDGLGAITYSFLEPGTYIFKVITSTNNHVWNEEYATITLHINYPWWNTIAARIVYAIIFILLTYIVVLYINRRNKKKKLRLREKEMIMQKEELNQFKIKFFTNISHELRTPLTLIITPLESIIKKEKDTQNKIQLSSIRRNALQLLEMVNQLLDFRKLEMKKEELNLSNENIVEFVEVVCSSFVETAHDKMINFTCMSKWDSLYTSFDKSKIQKIINNLLSNAFKFTPAGGSVSVEVDKVVCDLQTTQEDMITIKVTDTGIGISESEIPNIFTRFYQSGNNAQSNFTSGSGIGLHIIKEYVELHKGNLEVTSKEGVGTTFTVFIPFVKVADKTETREPDDALDSDNPIVEQMKHGSENYTILFVEDNPEFRNYVINELRQYYNVVEAQNGQEGLNIVKSQNIDLIISDIMMPVMDGTEMCRLLKTDIETSHIPIILLTAKASDENKMSGYEAGADEYISKPFNFDILFVRIKYLIEQQQKRIEIFNREIEINPSMLTITPLDEQLIQKALKCVEENMENPKFSVEDLSTYVGMHRMNLYRKLQSIVGQTPSIFIRSIRLKRAAQLLQNSHLTVSEIAYMVGFSSVKYFGRYFKEEFGVTPSQYAENHKTSAPLN